MNGTVVDIRNGRPFEVSEPDDFGTPEPARTPDQQRAYDEGYQKGLADAEARYSQEVEYVVGRFGRGRKSSRQPQSPLSLA